MTDPVIETDSLTRQFGDVVAVDELDMTVQRGEVYGFLGPNGAGKTTTINMLLDFIHPTAGEARVLGRDVHEHSLEIRQRIGILPEGAQLYPRLSAREHVEFVAETKDVEVDPIAKLDRVGLDREDQKRAVAGYSKGMQQRLALAMALTGDPELLILDEPSSGLDPTGMAEMREIITAVAVSGTTIFFSSHLLEQVEAVCDRVGILSDGQLVAEDTIESLRELSGVNPVVEIAFAEPPETVTEIEAIDNVVAVETEGDSIEITCRDSAAKIDVIRTADRLGTVTNILAEEASLESLFERYTSNSSSAEIPQEVRA